MQQIVSKNQKLSKNDFILHHIEVGGTPKLFGRFLMMIYPEDWNEDDMDERIITDQCCWRSISLIIKIEIDQ